MDECGLILLCAIITFVVGIWSYLIGHDAGFKNGFYNGGMEHPALKSKSSTLYEPPDEGSRPKGATPIIGEAECPECKKKMSKKLMVYIEMPNGDFGWYCSYKCAINEMESELSQ